ncbi:hypothetical protein PENTCL1PPCAC_9948, partial [Pristionchus entomophagus]
EEEEEEEAVDDSTSDGEMNSDDSEDDDEEDEEDEDEELERSIDSAKENDGLARSLQLQQSLPSISAFCAAPTANGLRALAAVGSERLKKMIEPFASSRDQTESARLFLSVIIAASGGEKVEKEAVDVIDTLVVSVSSHPRKPIPTIVQLMNHVVAHVDVNIRREENLVDLSSIGRPTLERVLQELQQRGRLVEARGMLGHYFPSVNAATAAPTAVAPPRQTFSFSFGTNNTASPVIPKFNFGGK